MANKEIKHLGLISEELKHPTKQQIIERWDTLGFLGELPHDDKEHIALSFESMSDYLLYGDYDFKVSPMLECGIFVLIRRAMTDRKDGHVVVKRVVEAEEVINILRTYTLHDLQTFWEDTPEDINERVSAESLRRLIELGNVETNNILSLYNLNYDRSSDNSDEFAKNAAFVCYILGIDIEAEVARIVGKFLQHKLLETQK